MAAALAAVTFAAYVPSLGNRFVNWDDQAYVAGNPFLAEGMSWASVRWSLAAFHSGNWHPLTWVSHALDLSLYGRDRVWGHHLTSILLHAACAAVLLAALVRLTRRLWPSALVAALFALHPLHVESVSWISERKDVLCALFTFLTFWAYARYAEAPSWRRYLVVAVGAAAALMSKPMAVTLPFVLLVLDWWPLQRLSWRTAMEKIPLFAMAGATALLTFFAQVTGGAVSSLGAITLQTRVAHAAVAYVVYLFKAFCPSPGSLSPFYPSAADGGTLLTPRKVQLAILLLVCVTLAVWRFRGRRPYLLTGWLLYAGMLVPVSGLVQVGRQIMADRYTYVPLLGVFLVVVWVADETVRARPMLRRVALWFAPILLAALAALTWQQQAVWRDTVTLWNRVLRNYPECAQAWHSLGHAYIGVDPDKDLRAKVDLDKAGECYRKAMSLAPKDPEPLISLASVLADKGQSEEAEKHFRRAIELRPRFADAQFNYGIFLLNRSRTDEAIKRFRVTLEIDPGHADAMRALATVQAPESQPAFP